MISIRAFRDFLQLNVIGFYLRQKELRQQPPVIVDDDLLQDSDFVKFTGMHLDKGLTLGDHVDQICTKVTSRLCST